MLWTSSKDRWHEAYIRRALGLESRHYIYIRYVRFKISCHVSNLWNAHACMAGMTGLRWISSARWHRQLHWREDGLSKFPVTQGFRCGWWNKNCCQQSLPSQCGLMRRYLGCGSSWLCRYCKCQINLFGETSLNFPKLSLHLITFLNFKNSQFSKCLHLSIYFNFTHPLIFSIKS